MPDKEWDLIKAAYLASAVKQEQYPELQGTEIAFIGRSNVGKSSLINSLTRNRQLARTSRTPGKTRTINFFSVQAKANLAMPVYKDFFIVDLPGYGYAKASREDKRSWAAFIQRYLQNSFRLAKVYQLIDIRHELMPNDAECFSWLAGLGINVGIVFTKADKVSQSVAAGNKRVICNALGIETNKATLYSSVKNTGRMQLIKDIMQQVE